MRLLLNKWTWEFANRVMGVTEDGDKARLPMLAGTLSEGVAREFMTFSALFKDLPKMSAVEDSPETVKIPDEPSILFLLTGAIAAHAKKDNITNLMKFIKRLPVEFQVVCLRQTIKRNPEVGASPAVQQWAATSAANLF